MPKFSGLFDSFDNLDQISPEAIASWLKPVPQLTILENYLANKILYPQSLPKTEYEMQIDLAILREALKMNAPKVASGANTLYGDNPFLNKTLRKMLIPARLLNFVPDLATLTGVFIDALLLPRKKGDFFEDLWTIVLTGDGDEVIGSILLPEFEGGKGIMDLNFQNKKYRVTQGNLYLLPCSTDRCEIAYRIQNGKALGKIESSIEVCGGKLGLIIDGRKV